MFTRASASSGGGGGVDLNNYEYNVIKPTIQMTGGVFTYTFDKPVYLIQVDLYRGVSLAPVPIMQIYDEDGTTPLSEAVTMTLNTVVPVINNYLEKQLSRFYLKQTNGSASWTSGTNNSRIYVLQPKN